MTKDGEELVASAVSLLNDVLDLCSPRGIFSVVNLQQFNFKLARTRGS